MEDIDEILKSSSVFAHAPMNAAPPPQVAPAAAASAAGASAGGSGGGGGATIAKPVYKPIVYDLKNEGGSATANTKTGGGGGGGAGGGKACFLCQEVGHQARNCPTNTDKSGAGPCYECGKTGHRAKDCPTPTGNAKQYLAKSATGAKCFNCGKTGHIANDCKAPKPAAGEKACHVCGKTGHLARDCRFAGDSKKAGGASGGGGGGGSSSHFSVSNASAFRLFVGNLSYQTTWQSLKDHIRKAVQNVSRCDIMLLPDGKSKGCGIVEVGSAADMAAAVALTDTELDGRKIFVRPDREEAGYGHAGVASGGSFGGKSTVYGGGGRGRTNSSGDGGVSLYVGNLSYTVTWQMLKDLFAGYGDVLRADVATENGGRSKGFGIVKMQNQKAANKAIDALHNTDFEGRALIVREDTRA